MIPAFKFPFSQGPEAPYENAVRTTYMALGEYSKPARIIRRMGHDIRTYDISNISSLLEELGQPKFRTKQLVKWLYVDGASSYDAMTNLPLSLRATLAERYPLTSLAVVDKQISRDGTRKYVFEFSDGVRVEAVGMPSFSLKKSGEPEHLSVCFSTQAGCAMQCAFCATGKEGLTRNLSSGEMVSEILAVQQDFGFRVSHIVAMGQGEPFQNYDSTLEALRFLNAKDGLGIGARHITLSTCGILPGLKRFSCEPEQFTLAVSLHSARQEVRNALMPRCAGISLEELKTHLVSYVLQTGRRVSLEYLLIRGVNDGEPDLRALISFCDGLLCHVNLIPINAIEGSELQPSSKETQNRWVRELEASGKETTIRNSRGADIDGACGQLKNKLK